jgi:DNA-binding transcriptional ArsR family regulator
MGELTHVPGDPDLKRILWYVLGGARGGESRARIIRELEQRPSNLNQLATRLGLDYRTIMHHMDVLKKNALVTFEGEKYGQTYFLSPFLESQIGTFREICAKLGFSES